MVCIESIKNGAGQEIGTRFVYRKRRAYYIKVLNCFSARSLGLGACKCEKHHRWWYERIPDEKIARYLSKYLSFRDVEITLRQMGEWLDTKKTG